MGFDPVYDFDSSIEKVNKYSDIKVLRQSNWVHPNEVGYRQMEDVLAGAVQAIKK